MQAQLLMLANRLYLLLAYIGNSIATHTASILFTTYCKPLIKYTLPLTPHPSPLTHIAIGDPDGFWLATKGNTRKVQGRLNDIGMLIALHAERDSAGGFTAASRALLEDVSRWVRLYHMVR